MTLILDKKPDCRCCDNIIGRCQCIGQECEHCKQCEIHCECREKAEDKRLKQEKFDREENRFISLKQQERNVKAGLMSSGMKVSEAKAMACVWWNKIGRKLMNVKFNQEEVGGRFMASNGKAPGIKISPTLEATIPSGILQGFPWSRLTPREKFEVIKKWHDCEVMQNWPLFKEKYGLKIFDLPPHESKIIH